MKIWLDDLLLLVSAPQSTTAKCSASQPMPALGLAPQSTDAQPTTTSAAGSVPALDHNTFCFRSNKRFALGFFPFFKLLQTPSESAFPMHTQMHQINVGYQTRFFLGTTSHFFGPGMDVHGIHHGGCLLILIISVSQSRVVLWPMTHCVRTRNRPNSPI